MRLWSISPEYLDRQGFVGLWREALHAQKVLLGQTRAYKNHPQLDRFKQLGDQAVPAIVEYLKWLYRESLYRGYKFNKDLIVPADNFIGPIIVSQGQLDYEYNLLRQKVIKRDWDWWFQLEILRPDEINPHQIFEVDDEDKEPEPWERVKYVINRLQA